MTLIFKSWLYIKMCFKNILRNGRRTIATLGSIFTGTIALILVTGYLYVMEQGLQNHAISSEFGHIQIARTGYFEEDQSAYDFMMEANEHERIEDLLYGFPEVDLVNKRLHFSGIIGNRSSSTTFSGICGQREIEIFMSPSLVKGRHFGVASGNGIIIGKSMAAKLGADIDTEFQVFFPSPTGETREFSATVTGIYHGLMAEQEESVIFFPLETAWESMPERKVHRIIVLLREINDIPSVKRELNRLIASEGLDVEIRDWSEMATFYDQIIAMFMRIVVVLGALILLVIVFGIANTMYMVIHDRKKEIGTMRALGDSRLRVIAQLVTEGTIMGLLGVCTAVALALLLVPLINRLGIMLPPGPGQDEPIPLYIMLEPLTVLIIAAGTAVVSGCSSILPAIGAVRVKVADALRSS